MLFRPELADEILLGHKRQTRRLVKPGHTPYVNCDLPDRPYSLITDTWGRLIWQVGKGYAVCPGRGKAAVARIKIVTIRKERLQAISDMDLLMEGIDFTYVGADQKQTRRNSFTYLWDRLNDKPGARWKDNPWVWVLTFELAKAAE